MIVIKCKNCGKKWTGATEEEARENVDIYPCKCDKSSRDLEVSKH